MSIKLVSANPDYLQRSVDPGLSFPFAISLWFNPSALNLDMVLASVADASVEDNFHALMLKGTLGTNFVHALSDNAAAISTGGMVSVNTWYHVLGVWESASIRKIYLDGTNEGTDTTAKTIAGIDTLTVGRLGRLTPSNPTNGRVSDLALWDLSTPFTAEERTQLGIVGVSPLLIRADELISYTPMPGIDTDPIVDVVGGFHLTQFGSPVTGEDNPPILAPVPGQVEPPSLSAINASVISSVGFGQVALNNIKTGDITQALAFTQEALNNIRQGVASSDIFLQGAGLNNIKQGVASSSILLDQPDVGTNVKFHSASNNLLLDQLEPFTNIKILSASNSFLLTGFAGRHIEISLTQNLGFIAFAFTNIKFLSVGTTFGLTGVEQSGGSEFNRSFTQRFLFEQAVRRTIDGSASSSILFSQEAARRLDGLSELLFAGIVTVDQCKGVISALLFEGEVTYNHDRAIQATSGVLFESFVAGVITAGLGVNCDLYGDGPGTRADITLSSASAGIITLRNPNFGNSYDQDTKRILRRSRGGSVLVLRDPIWPKKTTLEMSFTSLPKAKAKELLTFLEMSLGELVTLVDQENQSWDGIILSPDAGIVDIQGQDCSYEASLTFIGEKP